MYRLCLQTLVSARRNPVLLLVLILLFSAQAGFFQADLVDSEGLEKRIGAESSERTSTLVDVPTWRIGDRWNYDGFLDVKDFVADSGISTNVQTLDGTLDSRVTAIYTTVIENVSTLVYKVESDGEYEAEDVNLAGYDGDLIIEIDTIEIIRASDLATIEQEATIDIDFIYTIWWWDYTIHVADLVVTNEFSPSLEKYDFPISVGEEWSTDYTQTTTYTGTSDYVTIPDGTTGSITSSWEVVSRGQSGVNYGGCGQSYNITTYDSDGEETGYYWYCPAIRNNIKSSTTESIGFIATHELNFYQVSTRTRTLDVDIEYQLSPLDMDMNATITVTDNSGEVVSGQSVEFRYEIEEDIRSATTDTNGQIVFALNSGDEADASIGGTELGSHGIIVWLPSANQIGAATVTIDPDVHPVDMVANTAGVTVERTRDNRTISLNSIIGFTAIPNDILTFSVPVMNRGILTSPATTIRVTGPDGVGSTSAVPSLQSLGEKRVEVDWVVPAGQPVGDASVSFVVDENEEISEDGNRSNNAGSFSVFIGRLPSAVLNAPATIKTLQTISLNGLYSNDPDGGSISCEFRVETVSGATITAIEDDCIFEYEWDDDGEYLVSLLVTDEESDSDRVETTIVVQNRPPEITVEAESQTIPVLSPITFEVTERSDLDTRNQFAPVDIMWQTSCEEGSTVSARCTVTPTIEGEYTIEVVGMDDDGDTVSERVSVSVTNIAPWDPGVEIWNGATKLLPDSRGMYSATEGDLLEIRGSAEDSSNDIDSLVHTWSPDAEDHPGLVQVSSGRYSTVEHVYITSGVHLATLVVTDDDGESAETLVVAIEVFNLAPTIAPVSPPLPVAEDGEISLTIDVWDTLGDRENLLNCFDLDPSTNSDGEGNSTDDCDVEGIAVTLSWPDAAVAPSSIIFHTTDDDGAVAMIEIPITVNNVKPSSHAMASNENPIEGSMVILSANLTTDSIHDMANMRYTWDLDTSVDSDGDGNAANDVDDERIWFEWKAEGVGSRTIKLTAWDEGTSHSMLLLVNVEKQAFSFGELVGPYGIVILLVVVIAALGGVLSMRLRKPKDLVEAPAGARGGRRVSMDDAFDDPEYDPFSGDAKKRRVKRPEETEEETDLQEDSTNAEESEAVASEAEEAPVIEKTALDEEYEEISSESVDISDFLDDLTDGSGDVEGETDQSSEADDEDQDSADDEDDANGDLADEQSEALMDEEE